MVEGSLFRLDDIVKVAGFNGRVFKIYSVKYTERFVLGVFYYGFLYKVMDLRTYEILDDVFENDIQLVERLNKKKDKPLLTYEQIKWQEYEDNLTLYEIFGDEKYQDAAVNIYCELIHNRDR